MKFDDRYGPLDRVLFRIAFRASAAQHAVADVERMLYGDRLRSVPVERPVFITALPRSGTTILLKLLWRTGHFASHIYRDMPFVLCPMLWSRFSDRFAVDDTPRERAHGDGLRVSGSSPEAFDEMVWKRFWPGHYLRDRIVPWTSRDRMPEFETFFESHMRKVIALRREGPDDDRRYLSKNNLNIARIAAPPPPLDNGVWLVPFREPLQQAASMLEQHHRFVEIHGRDDFVRVYMEAIGHHEFGLGLKPIDFGGWLQTNPGPPSRLEFWLRYWIAAYRHVLEHAGPSAVLLSYARLVEAPEIALAKVAEGVEVPTSDLVSQAHRLRPPRTHEVDRQDVTGRILDAARALYEELEDGAETVRTGEA